jgi:Nucleotidyltransferase of unknown function (DUF6036)
MTRGQLERAIRAAGAICGDRELYVVGSQAILGRFPDAHPDLLRSMEVDIAPRNHPELESLIEGSIGELSPFHKTFGFHVDGVTIDGIVLPKGWQDRLVVVDNANTGGFRGLCLDPADLAVSKLAAARPKDIEFVRVMLRTGAVRPDVLRERAGSVSTLDEARMTRLAELAEQLTASSPES